MNESHDIRETDFVRQQTCDIIIRKGGRKHPTHTLGRENGSEDTAR